VETVLVALTVTPEAFEAASQARAELIVAHHPLIWDPLTTLREDVPQARLCLDIARAGIACYSAHTNLDIVPDGVNHVLAGRLELMDVAPLIPTPHVKQVKLITFVPEADVERVRAAICEAGAGVIGDYTYCTFSTEGVGTFLPGEESSPYSGNKNALNEEEERRLETLVPKARLSAVLEALFEAHPYEEVAYDLVELANTPVDLSLGLRGRLKKAMPLTKFAAIVREALEISHVRVVGDDARRVQSVAVLGGSGGGSIAQAPDDVDVFVTGDVKYHEAQGALDRGLAVIDAGHHGTEKWIVPALAQYLKSELPELRVGTYIEPDLFRVVTE
jgi:dinuclear metal center YbgI/SA1388 family protein